MKLRKVGINARRRQLELTTRSGVVYPFPFARLDPAPAPGNPVTKAFVDPELANEGVSYQLSSGEEGCLLLDQALDYNSDPAYAARMMLYRLSVTAGDGVTRSGLSIREIARRLGTSVPQVYRLLDPTNTTKSLVQLLSLLKVVGWEVDLVVRRPKRARPAVPARPAQRAAPVPKGEPLKGRAGRSPGTRRR